MTRCPFCPGFWVCPGTSDLVLHWQILGNSDRWVSLVSDMKVLTSVLPICIRFSLISYEKVITLMGHEEEACPQHVTKYLKWIQSTAGCEGQR